MTEDFVPETELERAYIQSIGWESHRLWRRARGSTEQEQWAVAAGLNVSRILDCAQNNRASTLVRTLESINFIVGNLNEPQKVSLFKCLADLTHRLLELDFELESKYVTVVLQLMLRLFFRAGELRGADIVCMMRQSFVLRNRSMVGPRPFTTVVRDSSRRFPALFGQPGTTLWLSTR